jgi:hypothetical protein
MAGREAAAAGGVNRPAVLKAAFFACLAIDEEPSVRNVVDMVRRITGKGIRIEDARKWLDSFKRDTVGIQAGNAPDTAAPRKSAISETDGIQAGNLRAGAAKELELQALSFGDSGSASEPAAQAATLIPLPTPVRVISAYAGTTIESFGDHADLVREILACDGFGIETKAFRTALESLAMWRATYGEAAFVHGLRVTADKRFGHRYVGGVAKRYDPDRDEQRFTPRYEEPNASDLLPTLTELYESGVVERPDSAAIIASRPAWVNERIAALMADA